MPRRRKKAANLSLDDDGLLDLIQETYNDILTEKNYALKGFKDIKATVDETRIDQIPLYGQTLINYLKIVDNANDKKLKLIRIMKDITAEEPKNSNVNGNTSNLPSGKDRKELLSKLDNMDIKKLMKDKDKNE